MATGGKCDFRVLVSAGSLFGMCPGLALWPGNTSASQLFEQPALHAVFPGMLFQVADVEKCCDWNDFPPLSSCREGQPALRGTCLPWAEPVTRLCMLWCFFHWGQPVHQVVANHSVGTKYLCWYRKIPEKKDKSTGTFLLHIKTLSCQEFAGLLLVKGIVFFLPLFSQISARLYAVPCPFHTSYCAPQSKSHLGGTVLTLDFLILPATINQPDRWCGEAQIHPPSLLLSTFACSSASLPAVYSKDSSQM